MQRESREALVLKYERGLLTATPTVERLLAGRTLSAGHQWDVVISVLGNPTVSVDVRTADGKLEAAVLANLPLFVDGQVYGRTDTPVGPEPSLDPSYLFERAVTWLARIWQEQRPGQALVRCLDDPPEGPTVPADRRCYSLTAGAWMPDPRWD